MITLNMLKKSHKVIDNSFINTYTVNRMSVSYTHLSPNNAPTFVPPI